MKGESFSMFDLLVKRGLVASPEGVQQQSFVVSGGRIAALFRDGSEPEARETIDASGKIVLPGLVDAHVHFRDPGLTHKENFESGSRAAAAGGVTTVMVMPTDNPFTITPESFSEKIALGRGRSHVDFALQAGLGPDRRHVGALADLGAVSFEIFLSDLPESLLTGTRADLISALEAVRAVGLVAGITPGENSVYARFEELAKARYGGDRRAFAASRPPVAEAMGVADACLAGRLVGTPIHLRQISCADSIAVLSGLTTDATSAEVTPHNLLLAEDALIRLGPVAKVAPPLRPAADVQAVRQALSDGVIAMVATDHAPHTPDEKAAGLEDVWKAPGGFPGLQTFLPLMLRLLADGALTYPRLVEACCEAPARSFGLFPRKGTLRVGSDADFVIIDPAKPMTIRNEEQLSKARIVPFDGIEIPATPILTYLRGSAVMRDGTLSGAPCGRFVAPSR
jgi:dihydroorotase